MHRFHIPDLNGQSTLLTLTGSEATHAIKVLRVQQGDTVTALNGRGTRAVTRVLQATRKQVDLEVQNVEQAAQPVFECTLFQAVTKSRSMDWVVEKVTELGIHSIQPVLSERVVSKLDHEEAARKAAKWQRTAIESLKQCGGPWLPCIMPALPLGTALEQGAGIPLHLMGSLSPEAKELRWALRSKALTKNPTSPMRVGIWIGPEGDFSPEEAVKLRSAGAIPITLGRNTLRSETAAVCALT